MRCPRCGAPLTPDGIRVDLHHCDQCGEVEVDEEGAYVNGFFYERGTDKDGEGFGDAEDEDDGEEADYVPTWQDVLADDFDEEPDEEDR